MSENAFSRPSVLHLTTKYDGQKTVVDEVYFTSPLKVLPEYWQETLRRFLFMSAKIPGWN